MILKIQKCADLFGEVWKFWSGEGKFTFNNSGVSADLDDRTEKIVIILVGIEPIFLYVILVV